MSEAKAIPSNLPERKEGIFRQEHCASWAPVPLSCIYLYPFMHAEKVPFFPILSSGIFAEKKWSEIPEFKKGGNPYKLGRTPLPCQIVIAYKVGLHLPPLPPPFLQNWIEKRILVNQDCCWWAKFWSKWTFRQENILSGFALDHLLEHLSGFLCNIF